MYGDHRMKKYILIFFVLTVCASAQRVNIRAGYGLLEIRDSVLTLLLDSLVVRLQTAPQISDSLDLIPRAINVTGGTGMQTLDGITAQAIDLVPGKGVAITPNAGDSTIRFDLAGRPVVPVTDFVWSDTVSWTAIFQNAIDSCKGKILYIPGGLYEFDAAGECPYEAGKEYILDLGTGNTTIWISPGATLQIHAGLQVDSAINFIVWKDAADIYIGGGGTITLNASNQPDWVANGGSTWASDNGYCQGEAGNIILGYQTGSTYDESSDITIENLVLKDCFSNPLDIHGATGVIVRNIRAWSFGEGPQVVFGKNVIMDNIFVSDKHEPPYWTAGGVGDGIEAASCVDFVISSCVIRDYQTTGHIDISYSSRGTITGCIVDSAGSLLETQSPLGNYYSDDITISNCVVKKPGTHGIWWMSPGSATILGVLIDSVKSGAAGIYVVNNRRPVYISGCTIRNASYGIFTSNGLIEVTGCSFDSTERGVAIWRGGASEAPVVNIAGSIFRDCSVAGVEVNAGGEVDYDARGSVVGSSFKNCPYMPIRFPNAADADSLNFHFQYHDLNGNKLRSNMLTFGTDSTVLANKGYVDTRIGAIGGAIDTAALHAQKFADISDALAAWRDTSRIWRTFVTRHGSAIAIDSATAGKYVVWMNPDSTAAWLRDTSMTWVLNLILQKSDTAFQLRVTHPELSNLAAVSTADSNRVVCIDASTGRLKICWDDGGSGVTLAQVSATLDSGAVRPAALQTAIDTLARLGRRWTARAVLDATVTVDTTNTIYFSDRGTKGPGPSALLNFSTVPVSCYIVGIAISYVKDSAGYRMWRDTVRALAGYGADSVEAGSTLFATWWPASLGYPPSSGGLGLQKIVIAKRAYNYVPPTPSATYAWTFLSSTNTKAPLALPWDSGVNPGQRGLGEGGAMIVEIYLAEKLPGRVY